MKNINFILLVILAVFIFNDSTMADTDDREVEYYEGMCGTRIAQPGGWPYCEESEETCYIKIVYKDGSEDWEDYEALYDPFTGKGYIDIDGVTHINAPQGGFYFNIGLNGSTEIVSVSSLQDFIDYIENN